MTMSEYVFERKNATQIDIERPQFLQTPMRYIAVEVKDLLDALCVAQYLTRHFNNSSLNISPNADSFGSDTAI